MKNAVLVLGLFVLSVLVTASFSLAAIDFTDECYEGSFLEVALGFEEGAEPPINNGTLTLSNTCDSGNGNEIAWEEPVGLVLGNITDGDVIITDTSIYVDSFARPDLDVPATLTFKNTPFAVEPDLLKDGVACGDCSNEAFNPTTRTYTVDVTGFSNYSLQALQEFSVYSDAEPELADRVYQTIDLGNAYRATEFRCVVQIFAVNEQNQYVLIQTNPERKVAARLWGSPDTNNPESLGYFKTENGLANVYFNGKVLSGYTDAQYVAMCASNSTKLVYEESISTRYKPVGRELVGRGVWFTSGSNAFYISVWVVGLFIVFFLVLKFIKVARGR